MITALIIVALIALFGTSNGEARLQSVLNIFPGRKFWQNKSDDDTQAYSELYCATAVRLGVLIARTEDRGQTVTLDTLKRIFDLRDVTLPDVETIYQSQLVSPQDMESITAPYLFENDVDFARNESLVFGMTRVAMLNGDMSSEELGLVRETAKTLGVTDGTLRRIFLKAGYIEASTGSSSSQHQGRAVDPYSLRNTHLQTLGLTADADETAVRGAWRRMAAQYHPDKLQSQNLSKEALMGAATKMQSVNEAYNWLKQHGL